jgi:hypothetical protein
MALPERIYPESWSIGVLEKGKASVIFSERGFF